MKKKGVAGVRQDKRINIQLTTDRQREVYKQMKVLAAKLGVPLKELVLAMFEERLSQEK